jgi:hypothetical protein
MRLIFLRKNILLYLLVFTVLLISSTVYAWFVKDSSIELYATGTSIVNYFARGTGEENDPYIINDKKHLYHLAWLQNLGYFGNEKIYFEIENDINMEGMALPPIGTEEHPFYGTLNGNYHVISNLFISNNKNELITNFNLQNVNLGSKVGFFGKIDAPSNPENPNAPYNPAWAGEAKNFYLENVNVTNIVNNSVIGIVAGHNNGHLSDIGVSNNSLKLTGGIYSQSDYVLIGELGPNTYWEGMPSDGGSKILIDPNDSWGGDLRSTSSQKYRMIESSILEHAYYTSVITSDTASNPKDFYFINQVTQSGSGNQFTLTPTTTGYTKINNVNEATAKGISETFWYYYQNASGNQKIRYLMLGGTPTINSTVLVPFEGTNISIPQNGIWFKPKSNGTTGISFMITNKSNNSAMSIYQFTRQPDGTINSWTEYSFIFPVTGQYPFKNYDILYFTFEVDSNYEYFVGISQNSPNADAGFVYLVLHGVGYSGSDISMVQNVDYVMRQNGVFPRVSESTLNNALLTFKGTASSTGYLYFNKTNYSGTYVYYYSAINGLEIRDLAAGTKDAKLATTGLNTIFPDWMSNYQNNP